MAAEAARFPISSIRYPLSASLRIVPCFPSPPFRFAAGRDY